MVSGTVAADAAVRAHTVTVTANDGTNDAVMATFKITVTENRPPAIANPGNKAYAPGQTIEAFPIAVTDADGDTVRVTVTGLPAGLTYSSETGRVSGTVAADAAARAYTVTVTANDGTYDPVTTFTITITIAGTRDLDRQRALLFWVNPSTNEVEGIEYGVYHVDYLREEGEEGVCPADTATLHDITVRFPGGALLAQSSVRDSDSFGVSGLAPVTTTFLSDMPQPVYPLSDVRRDPFDETLVTLYRPGDDPRFLESIQIDRRVPQNPTFPGQTDGDDPGGLLGYITEGLDITFSTTPPGCMVRLAFW